MASYTIRVFQTIASLLLLKRYSCAATIPREFVMYTEDAQVGWNRAQEVCESIGMKLAVMDYDAHTYIRGLMEENWFKNAAKKDMWIGLYDSDLDDDSQSAAGYSWQVDCSSLAHSPWTGWKSGDPQNTGDSWCVAITKDKAEWITKICDEERLILCQKPKDACDYTQSSRWYSNIKTHKSACFSLRIDDTSLSGSGSAEPEVTCLPESTTTSSTTASTTSTTSATTSTTTAPATTPTTSQTTSTTSTTVTPTTSTTTPTTSTTSSTTPTTSSSTSTSSTTPTPTTSTTTASTTSTPSSTTRTNSSTSTSLTPPTQTTSTTTTSQSTTTTDQLSPPNASDRCPCPCTTPEETNLSQEKLQAESEKIQKELTVDASQLSSRRRAKESAVDLRPSAAGIGIVGITMLVGAALTILLSDLSLFYQKRWLCCRRDDKKRLTAQSHNGLF